ncbi:Protein-S-isoprenylcysteine O-methyltransferase [Abortiporus biennis]
MMIDSISIWELSSLLLKLFILQLDAIAIRYGLDWDHAIPKSEETKIYATTDETADPGLWASHRAVNLLFILEKICRVFLLCEVYNIISSTFPIFSISFLNKTTSSESGTPESSNSNSNIIIISSSSLPPSFLISSLLIILGGFLRLQCYRTLGQYFTMQLAIRQDHKLITHGPYSIVRHPSYTGGIMLWAGIPFLTVGRGSWFWESGMWDARIPMNLINLINPTIVENMNILPFGGNVGFSLRVGALMGILWIIPWVSFIVISIRRVWREDLMLKKQFGEKWIEWERKTPYALVPYIF